MANVEDVVRHFNADEFVTIVLENEKETFVVQKALLCNTSEYFARALAAGFKETDQQVLTLPGADLQSLKLFIYWMCKHKLPDPAQEIDRHTYGSQEMKECITKKVEVLVRLWCFADQFLIPKLQNAAMKLILDLLRRSYVRAEIVDLSFHLTAENSVLRAATVRFFLHSHNPKSPGTNVYGGLKYEKEDIDRLGSTPGLMPVFMELISKSPCGRYPCGCGASCYRIKETEDSQFMVNE